MSLTPAIWTKHANPAEITADHSLSPARPAPGAWVAEGQLHHDLETLFIRQQNALAAIAALAAEHHVGLAKIHGEYKFFLERDIAGPDGKNSLPAEWRRTGASDYSYWLVHEDKAVNQTLDRLNRDLLSAHSFTGFVRHYCTRMGVLEFRPGETTEQMSARHAASETFFDSMKVERLFDRYYITATAVEGGHVPGAHEIGYGAYLRVVAAHYDASAAPSPAASP